jgi:maltose-binding protein MalE
MVSLPRNPPRNRSVERSALVLKQQWLRTIPALMLALVLTLGGGTLALAQDEEEALSGNLVLWHSWTGAEAETLTNDILPAWQAAYPDVQIELLAVPFDQLRNKFQTEVATGGGPDLLIGPHDWVGDFVLADLIQPVNELLDPAALESYLPSTVEALSVDGTAYGLPERFDAVALYYNKQFVTEPPTTTAEMDELAAAITAENPEVYGMAHRSGFYHSAAFLFGFGAQLFDEENMSALNSPETVAFLNWLNETSQKPGYFMQNDDAAINSLFQQGQAAMVVQGPWALGDFQNSIGAENVGVVPIPTITEAGDAAAMPFLGVTGIMINANADEEQARLAAAFAEWFTGPESAGILAEQNGHLPAHLEIELSDNPIAAAFVAQAENAVPTPNIPQMGQVWVPADDMIAKVLSGDATAEEAAAAAAETINQGIEQLGL